ncbi:Protein Simiate [Turdus rufiventris]|nr:Protein Simiate [Turdus rufiventris]
MAEGAAGPGGAERYFTRWYKPESVSSLWQKPTLFFKVGKQLKTLITKSVQTVADFRIKSLGSQKGISSSDGEEYTIYSCIRGRLIEVNENILSNPALLQEKPSTEGYIAVVLPKFEESKSITQGLLTQKEYEEVLLKRRSSAS